jgi:hypothetical protein
VVEYEREREREREELRRIYYFKICRFARDCVLMLLLCKNYTRIELFNTSDLQEVTFQYPLKLSTTQILLPEAILPIFVWKSLPRFSKVPQNSEVTSTGGFVGDWDIDEGDVSLQGRASD